jgi:hypothetical protein
MTSPIGEPMPEELGGLARGDDWTITDHLAFTFEVPLDDVEALLPPGVMAVQPAPGLGLAQIIHARYAAGTLGERDPFDEVVCSILVEPDLSLPMPLPKVTLYVVDVLSNSLRFVEHKRPALEMPVHHAPTLEGGFSEDGRACWLRDGDGPLLELGCPDARQFKPRAMYGQYFARRHEQVHHSVWAWRGSLFESQRSAPDTGRVHDHPWLRSLGLAAIADAPCYMRQLREPGCRVVMRTYAPRQFGKPTRRRSAEYDGARPPLT